MINRKEIPLWVKKGTLVWVEIRDKDDIEVLEYLEAIVSEFNTDERIVKVRYISK